MQIKLYKKSYKRAACTYKEKSLSLKSLFALKKKKKKKKSLDNQ